MKHLKLILTTLALLIFSCSSDDGDENRNMSNDNINNSDGCGLVNVQGKVYSQIQLESNSGVNIKDIPNPKLPILFELSDSNEVNSKTMRFKYVSQFSADNNGFISFENFDEDDFFFSTYTKINDCDLRAGRPNSTPSNRRENVVFDLTNCDPVRSAFSNILNINDNGNTIEVIESCGDEIITPNDFETKSVNYYLTDIKF